MHSKARGARVWSGAERGECLEEELHAVRDVVAAAFGQDYEKLTREAGAFTLRLSELAGIEVLSAAMMLYEAARQEHGIASGLVLAWYYDTMCGPLSPKEAVN